MSCIYIEITCILDAQQKVGMDKCLFIFLFTYPFNQSLIDLTFSFSNSVIWIGTRSDSNHPQWRTNLKRLIFPQKSSYSLFLCVLICFGGKVLLYCPGWLRIYQVNQTGFDLTDTSLPLPPLSRSIKGVCYQAWNFSLPNIEIY